jgi:polyisoprenyl-phosphate glycosyltransferase
VLAMKIAVVVPVFDDWASFRQLVAGVDAALGDLATEVVMLAVDDGSLASPAFDAGQDYQIIKEVRIVRLVTNVGSQRAIAIGLTVISKDEGLDYVVIMDGDGEDRPEDLPELLGSASPQTVVVASRRQRSEGFVFRAFYFCYKLFFRQLTGRSIDFGNYCVIPAVFLEHLTHQPDLWNHLAACLVRSRIPLISVAVPRGTRYFGRSHMNLVSLIVHGFSAVSVFSDSAFVRLMLGSLSLAGFTLFGAVVILAIRLSTTWATPGWASTVLLSLAVIFLQAMVLSIGAIFLHLNGRSTPSVVPASMSGDFVGEVISVEQGRGTGSCAAMIR